MDIKTYIDNYGREGKYLSEGRVKGRNLLLRNGFTTCGNKNFLQNGGTYAHYNKLRGVWFLDEPVETKDGVLIFT